MAANLNSFIDEDFLSILEKLRIVSKKGRTGPQKGEHRSWQSGEGIEFLDYRKYHPGDDLRYVDWSVYGRLDKLFIKLFHAEENQTAHLLLDMSRSMAAGDPPKEICAKKIAAAASYIGLSNLDKVGMMSFADRIIDIRPPVRGKKKFPEVLNFLLRSTSASQTNVNACLSEYALICKNPGIAVIVSDLLDPKGYQDGLKALAYRHFDVNLIQVLDPLELFGSQTGNLALRDVETGEKKVTFVDDALLGLYRRKIDAFIAGIRDYCSRYNINYYLWNTRVAFEDFMKDYLTKGVIFH